MRAATSWSWGSCGIAYCVTYCRYEKTSVLWKNVVNRDFEIVGSFFKIPLAYARGSDWSELRCKHLPGDCDRIPKNDYFLDMLTEVLSWGLEPAYVTGDSWYSCIKNLKTIKNHQLGFLFALEANRLVSLVKGTWVQVQSLDVPKDGLVVWLRDFGQVKLFRTSLKNQARHYIIHLPEENDSNNNGCRSFRTTKKQD